MKYKNKLMDTSTVALLVAALVIGALILILLFLNNKVLAPKIEEGSKSSEVKPKKKVNIEELVAKIKEKYPEIIYETNNEAKYKSIVYKENVDNENLEEISVSKDKINSAIIDIETGEELTFLDILKKDKLEDFKNKEKELLNLKYPEFIVNGILNSDGIKGYYVTERDVTIYYYDYQYDYSLNEDVTLKIDFNEIKDLLNYKPELNKNYQNENGYSYTSNKKTIALTFDDGPSGKYNPLILEELAKNKAHASFFMVGNMMNSCQNCVLQTYKSGNEIGSHTYEHINIKKGGDAVKESLAKTDNLYNSITGDHIKLLRPPYGAYNKDNLETINNVFVLWNLDTEDWRYRNVEHIVDYIKENVHDGAIILMHELYDSSYESLKIILPWLYANGYQVVSVSELAQIKGKTLEVGKAYMSLH